MFLISIFPWIYTQTILFYSSSCLRTSALPDKIPSRLFELSKSFLLSLFKILFKDCSISTVWVNERPYLWEEFLIELMRVSVHQYDGRNLLWLNYLLCNWKQKFFQLLQDVRTCSVLAFCTRVLFCYDSYVNNVPTD